MAHTPPNELGSIPYVNSLQQPTTMLPAKLYTFATLPAAAQNKGMIAVITDGAASPVYSAAAAGAGSLGTTVYSDGTTWRNG